MDNKYGKSANRKTAQITFENALSSSSSQSEDEGTIGSYARQPQSLAGSMRGTVNLQTNYDQVDRKMSFAKGELDWSDDSDDDDDPRIKGLTQKAKQQVQSQQKSMPLQEETKDFVTPLPPGEQSKYQQSLTKNDVNNSKSLAKAVALNRSTVNLSNNFKTGTIVGGLNSKTTALVGRQSTMVPPLNRLTMNDAMDDSDSDDQKDIFKTNFRPNRQTTTMISDFSRLTTRLPLEGRSEMAPERPQIDILQIIEQNEKKNEPLLEQIVNQEAQLLSQDQEHSDQKKEIMRFDQLGPLSTHINDDKQKYSGYVSCSATYGKYLFIGNSSGYVRVFDLESPKIADLRPLYDSSLAQNKVMCISLTPGMQYLVSGYKSGAIAVWDLQKYKLEKLITDVHSSEIMGARIFHITDENVINIVSAEVKGPVRLIEISSKSFFGGLNHSKVEIYQTRLKTVTSVQIHQPTDKQKQTYWGSKSLVAVGAMSEVVVCTMRPICEVFKIKRPAICKSKSIPYLDFGYGLTPEKQDSTVLILAVAWDQIIQLIYFEEGREHKIRMDGIYYTDQEISGCHFTGESILVILQNQKAVKMLYTKKFHHGDFNLLMPSSEKEQQLDFDSNRRQIREVTKFAELDKGQDEKNWIKNVRRQVIEVSESEKYQNFNHTVVRFKRQIFYIGDTKDPIVRMCVLTYQEYIDRLRSQTKTWLYLLKSTLEIFSGELKGFSNVPDEKVAREKEMMSFMKRQLFESLQSALPQSNSSNVEDEKKKLVSNQMETIAIRAAIEFCLNLQEFDFLFQDVCDYFTDRNMQDSFIAGLEQFVLSGKLRQVRIPQMIIRKMIYECEKSQKFWELERLIQQLDLTDYEYIDDLETLCQQQFMVSALLYILMTQNQEQISQTRSCMNILNSMYKIMIQAQRLEKQKLEQDRNTGRASTVLTPDKMTEVEKKFQLEQQQAIRKRKTQDLERLLGQITADDKYELEKSHVYIGYKLLWIIQMFLKGKKFPYGDLTEPQWRQHVFDIVNFIQTDEYLKEILEFDPEMFFRVISRLFRGKPWQFLSQSQVNSQDCSFDPTEILALIETRCLKAKTLSQNSAVLDCFYVFILHVTVAQHEERKKGATDKPIAFGKRSAKTMTMDYHIVLKAIENQLQPRPNIPIISSQNKVDETLVIGALRAQQLKKEDIDKIHKIIKDQPETSAFINIQIELHEGLKNYVDAFKCLLLSKTQQMRVFDWLNYSLLTLQEDDATQKDFYSLKDAAKQHLRDIIQLEVNDFNQQNQQKPIIIQKQSDSQEQVYKTRKSYDLIMKWFDEDQQLLYRLVSEELSSQPQTQFQFLKSYIGLREKKISDTIRESIFQPERQKQADLYNNLLIIFTRRLCEFEENSVVYWVSKDYFPTRQCMEICRSQQNFMAEAVMMEKLGDGMQAIKIYLEAIRKLDVKRISDQIKMVLDEDWKVGRVAKFDQLLLFDNIVELACSIASKKEGDSSKLKYGEEGWFEILEALQQLMIQSHINIDKAESQLRFQMKNLTSIQIDQEIARRKFELKKFIMARISYILQRDDNELSLRRVAERLNLDFHQVKKLCGDKLELLKANAKRESGCNMIQEHDNFYAFKQSDQYVTKGICVNSSFRKDQRFYQTQNRCYGCKKRLLESKFLAMLEAFACGHIYHSTCMSGKSECPACLKHVIPSYMDDGRGVNSEQRQEGRSIQEITQSSRLMSLDQRQRASTRLLDQLDSNLEVAQLSKSDFSDFRI